MCVRLDISQLVPARSLGRNVLLARVTTQPVTTRLRPTSYLETVSATDRTDSLTVSRHVTLASADRQLGQQVADCLARLHTRV